MISYFIEHWYWAERAYSNEKTNFACKKSKDQPPGMIVAVSRNKGTNTNKCDMFSLNEAHV